MLWGQASYNFNLIFLPSYLFNDMVYPTVAHTHNLDQEFLV